MKIAENYSKSKCNPSSNNEKEDKTLSNLKVNENGLRGRTFIHNGITVHIGYKDTERSLVDNLNQYFSQL